LQPTLTWVEVLKLVLHLGLRIFNIVDSGAVEPILFFNKKLIVFGVVIHHRVKGHLRVEDCSLYAKKGEN
jgi:hypothetical protein